MERDAESDLSALSSRLTSQPDGCGGTLLPSLISDAARGEWLRKPVIRKVIRGSLHSSRPSCVKPRHCA